MKRVKSFNNDNPTLYIVATPIGNLSEMTPRAIEILNEVDIIAVEDSRVTGKLLNYFNIENQMIIHHKHNEQKSSDKIIELLKAGKNVALVSDAGYPLISDPGQSVVSKAIFHDFNVVPISGSSATLNALVASGLNTIRFSFVGFLPIKQSDINELLADLENRSETLIFYEAPHRLHTTLNNIFNIFGERYIVIAREITKLHEEFIRGNLSEIIENLDEVKGEIVIVVEGKQKQDKEFLNIDLIDMVNTEIARGKSRSEAIKYVADLTNVKRNHIYKIFHNSLN